MSRSSEAGAASARRSGGKEFPEEAKTGPRKSKKARKAEEFALRVRLAIMTAPDVARYERPTSRGDCLPGGMNEARPCPFVSCAHHLALDVSRRTGSIRSTFPGVAPEDFGRRPSCALDVAERAGVTLEETGAYLNLTRERVRQIENLGLAVVREECEEAGLDEDDFETGPDRAEPAGAEDGAMGAYADPGKEEPDARFRLAFHKTMNARLREKAIARGEKVPPSSSSDEDDPSVDLATARAVRGKSGALVPWNDDDQLDLEVWLAHHPLLQPEIVARASALFHEPPKEEATSEETLEAAASESA